MHRDRVRVQPRRDPLVDRAVLEDLPDPGDPHHRVLTGALDDLRPRGLHPRAAPGVHPQIREPGAQLGDHRRGVVVPAGLEAGEEDGGRVGGHERRV
jgi:hypothetical protein